ncbi:glycoside hydrolase family 17 protein [Astrocystis sublimbata]|nr:glycoside hydrolase family 17 protein [Astrocystis sublimbata]
MYQVILLFTLASVASAAKLGFTYDEFFNFGGLKQPDFETLFTNAANLKGTEGWTSARLFTTTEPLTLGEPISAIPAAIKTNTSLLLGIWASAYDYGITSELTALKAAMDKYGHDFARLVDGISIGHEDLYHNSTQGSLDGSRGAGPDELVWYIKRVKAALSGTVLQDVPLGHVDRWQAWDNVSNQVVVDELDWIGLNFYPYLEKTQSNGIWSSRLLFQEALAKTRMAANGKEVWITETGHPVSGERSGDSIASLQNAERYWKEVGCPLFGKVNVWWYTLEDVDRLPYDDPSEPSFGIVGSLLSNEPLFNVSCDAEESDAYIEGLPQADTPSRMPTIMPI